MKDAQPVLADMVNAIEQIRCAVGDRGLAEYASDWLLKRAVERGIEIVSEASRRLPDSMKAAYPQIPWRRVAGMGNVLRHNYDSIVDEVIYDVVRNELPAVQTVLHSMQQSAEKPK